jgi:HAD superfamily hydrolase (TIGR01509 family)
MNNKPSPIKAIMFDWGHTLMDEVKSIETPLDTGSIDLMPGVLETLPQIKLPMGVWANTKNYSASDVEIWLRRAGISNYFSCVVTSSGVGYRKPDARFFSAALEKCGLKKDEVLFIGNQLNSDIKGANDFGIKNVWLSRENYRSKDDTLSPQDVKPTYTIHSLTEIPKIIQQIMAKG